MRNAIERWHSMSDDQIDKLCENLVAIHFVFMGLALFAYRLLPAIRGVSPEVVFGSLFR